MISKIWQLTIKIWQKNDSRVAKFGVINLLIEAKLGKADAENILYKLRDELKVPALIVTREENWNHNKNGIYIFSARRFLAELP